MSLLKTIQYSEAKDEVKAVYDHMIKRTGKIPKPVELTSVSPFFFQSLMRTIDYYSGHPNIDFSLLVLIRLLSSQSCSNDICLNFNRQILKKQGLDDIEIDKLLENPATAGLLKKDETLLMFVLKAVNDPEAIQDPDVQQLRDLGWTDTDIFDAVNTGVTMFALNKMMKIFKI